MKRDAIALSEKDNVATALTDLKAGAEVAVGIGERIEHVRLCHDIAFGHKFALRPIAAGADVLKYGEVIGRATAAIEPGAYAHVHNIESLRGRGDLAAAQAATKGA